MALTVRDPAFFFDTLSAMMLTEPSPEYVFDQFATIDVDFSAGNGDTVYLNRYPYFGDVGLTLANRILAETDSIGISDPVNQNVNQVSVELLELAGPYSSVKRGVAPLGVTEKVARQAEQKLIDSGNPESFFNSIGARSLKDDHDRFHDRALCNLFLATTNKYNPDGVVDGSTAVTGAGSTLSGDDLMAIKEVLQNNNAPTFSDGLYRAVISPRMEKHLRQDPDFKESMRYYNPTQLMRGEIGIFEGFRFFTSTNIPTATVNALTASQGVFFGMDAVGYGEGGLPLQVRSNKNDDYERFMYLIWLVYRGYSAMDYRFVVNARTFAS